MGLDDKSEGEEEATEPEEEVESMDPRWVESEGDMMVGSALRGEGRKIGEELGERRGLIVGGGEEIEVKYEGEQGEWKG